MTPEQRATCKHLPLDGAIEFAYAAGRASNSASVFSLSEANDMLLARVEVAEERIAKADGYLSRILHEMAGAVSLCWLPKPTGVFDSTQAHEFVAAAIAEIRAALAAQDKDANG